MNFKSLERVDQKCDEKAGDDSASTSVEVEVLLSRKERTELERLGDKDENSMMSVKSFGKSIIIGSNTNVLIITMIPTFQSTRSSSQ